MSNEVYQCCYTNLFRYDGPYKVGGWTTTAVSRDIPPEALRMCEQFQRVDSSDKGGLATDEGGRNPLRLYELLCGGQYACLIRTRYGMLDHGGRVNNLFSHAYILPLESFLRAPETLLRLNPSCFEQEIREEEFRRDGDERDIQEIKKEESARLSERASRRLRDGVLSLPDGDQDFTLQKAMQSLGFLSDRSRYAFLLQCFCAYLDEKREKSGKAPPLHIQYDAATETADLQLRRLLLCIFHGLPYSMRRELRVSNWTDIDNAPKDLMFTTQDVKSLLSGKDGAYLVLRTGETNLEKKRLKKAERAHEYLSDAARLSPERIPEFYAGLDERSKTLGDADASNDRIRKLAWQLFWDGENFRDKPSLKKFDNERQLKFLINDIVNGGVYSSALKGLLDEIGKRVPDETLTESLRNAVKAWRAECAARLPSDAPTQSAQEDAQTQSAQSDMQEESAQEETPTDTTQAASDALSEPSAAQKEWEARQAAQRQEWEAQQAELQRQREEFQREKEAQEEEIRRQQAELQRQRDAQTKSAQEPSREELERLQTEYAQQRSPVPPAPVPRQNPASPAKQFINNVGKTITGKFSPTPVGLVTPAIIKTPKSAIRRSPLPPPKDWDAIERDWDRMSKDDRAEMEKWLRQLLNVSLNARLAATTFQNNAPPDTCDQYLRLLIDRKVTGKIPSHGLVRQYCDLILDESKLKGIPERWKTLADAASIAQRMNEGSLTQRVAEETLELFRKELRPIAPDRRAVITLRKYAEIMERLYPDDKEALETNPTREEWIQKAKKHYWKVIKDAGTWKYFSFDALAEYEAFEDEDGRLYLELIRTVNYFRSDKEAAFLEHVHAFFRLDDIIPPSNEREQRKEITRILFNGLKAKYLSILDEYQEWLDMAALTQASEESAHVIWDLYAALYPFNPSRVTECYPEFNEAHKAWGDNEIRKCGYQFVLRACAENDANQTVPLDLWLRLGLQELSFQTFSKKRGKDMTNAFEILEIVQPEILNMAAEDVVKDSKLMNEALMQTYAQAYSKNSKDRNVKKSVQNWLKEVGRRKKLFGVF